MRGAQRRGRRAPCPIQSGGRLRMANRGIGCLVVVGLVLAGVVSAGARADDSGPPRNAAPGSLHLRGEPLATPIEIPGDPGRKLVTRVDIDIDDVRAETSS